jgi:hypothetical protein
MTAAEHRRDGSADDGQTWHHDDSTGVSWPTPEEVDRA